LEIAYINFNKAIVHGRITDGLDEYRVRKEREIEQVLTDEQKAKVEDLQIRQRDELHKLLRSFVAPA